MRNDGLPLDDLPFLDFYFPVFPGFGLINGDEIRAGQPDVVLFVDQHIGESIVRQKLLFSLALKAQELISIEPVEPVDAGYPDESCAILKDLNGFAVAQPFIHIENLDLYIGRLGQCRYGAGEERKNK